mmetsp:Transcript_14616/g.39546  ORF Transcript_14616/g.39546 Transcript_14616/m.39546 type:complete len:226 (-) Transcript_14616:200-877(-)
MAGLACCLRGSPSTVTSNSSNPPSCISWAARASNPAMVSGSMSSSSSSSSSLSSNTSSSASSPARASCRLCCREEDMDLRGMLPKPPPFLLVRRADSVGRRGAPAGLCLGWPLTALLDLLPPLLEVEGSEGEAAGDGRNGCAGCSCWSCCFSEAGASAALRFRGLKRARREASRIACKRSSRRRASSSLYAASSGSEPGCSHPCLAAQGAKREGEGMWKGWSLQW